MKVLCPDTSQALQGDLSGGSDGGVPSLQLRAEQVHARMQRSIHLHSHVQIISRTLVSLTCSLPQKSLHAIICTQAGTGIRAAAHREDLLDCAPQQPRMDGFWRSSWIHPIPP